MILWSKLELMDVNNQRKTRNLSGLAAAGDGIQKHHKMIWIPQMQEQWRKNLDGRLLLIP